MTGSYLGLLALDALLLAAGLGLLAALGFVRTLRAAVRFAGLAFVVGWAAAGIVFVLVLVAGLSLAVWQIAAACVALAAAGALVLRRTPPAAEPAPAPIGRGLRDLDWPPVVAIAAAAALGLYLGALGLRAVSTTASYHQDAWGFWLPKAKAIVLFGGLETEPGGVTSYPHADYPPLVPAHAAAAFRFMDGLYASLLPLQEWLLAAAFLGAVAGLLVRRVPGYVLWPSLLLVALAPSFGRAVGLSLADLPLAMLFALAGVALALWLREGQRAHLALAAILLAAAALTKSEGLLLAIALAAVAAVAARRLLPLLPLFVAPVVAVIPWRVWLEARDVEVPPDYRLGLLADPAELLDRAGRLGTALRELPGYLVGADAWLLVLPLALAAAALAVRRTPALTVLSLGTTAAVLLGLAVVYWIGELPVETYIDTSAERVVAAPILFAGALMPLALASALDPPG